MSYLLSDVGQLVLAVILAIVLAAIVFGIIAKMNRDLRKYDEYRAGTQIIRELTMAKLLEEFPELAGLDTGRCDDAVVADR